MTKLFRYLLVLAVVMSLAGAASFAQSGGEATYKAKCAMCHGAAGIPNPMMAKNMGIKAITDPAIKNLTVAQMIAAVKDGKGKMKPVAGIADAQIKEAVIYYRGFLNPQPLPPMPR
jgi:mono/diheme cytochrome c family protein